MPTPDLVAAPARLAPCIILIGMAGAGKSTVGGVLARELGWAFLDAECTVIRAIKANRTVIGTGGSVVYREEAMRHLAKLGPIVHLDLPLAVIEERIARNPQRGLAIAPGQTLADIFREREALYAAWADLRCDSQGKNPRECAQWILRHLPPELLGADA